MKLNYALDIQEAMMDNNGHVALKEKRLVYVKVKASSFMVPTQEFFIKVKEKNAYFAEI